MSLSLPRSRLRAKGNFRELRILRPKCTGGRKLSHGGNEGRKRKSENFSLPGQLLRWCLSAIFLVKFPFDSRHFASYSFSAFRGGILSKIDSYIRIFPNFNLHFTFPRMQKAWQYCKMCSAFCKRSQSFFFHFAFCMGLRTCNFNFTRNVLSSQQR